MAVCISALQYCEEHMGLEYSWQAYMEGSKSFWAIIFYLSLILLFAS